MTDILGILVNTDKHLDYVINLTKAAYGKGKRVRIFFTGNGVKLTQSAEFSTLAGMAELSICTESFYKFGFTADVPGVHPDGFVTQEKNAELIAGSDRYLVF
jgi:hypothetical protein